MLLDFRLGESTEDPTRIMYPPYKSRDEGTVILGQTRFGKSSLMLRMIEQDIQDMTAAVVLDPHGDLINDYFAGLEKSPIKGIGLLGPWTKFTTLSNSELRPGEVLVLQISSQASFSQIIPLIWESTALAP